MLKKHTDALYSNLWECLARDFKSAGYYDGPVKFDLDYLRHSPPKLAFDMGINEFKAQYQLNSLHKRYRFAFDSFTDEQLEEITNEKFIQNQARVARTVLPSKLWTHQVFQKMRVIIKKILLSYDKETHAALCRFGKRASIGVPFRDSYLDVKLSSPITGSQAHIDWFKDQLDVDYSLHRAVRQCSKGTEPTYRMCSTLALNNVAKSWKILRSIMANTTLGGYYSLGLGRYVEECLEQRTSINIHVQQQKHGRWVRRMSRNRKHVTLDTSMASDSFTSAHLRRVLPCDWYRALDKGRVRYVEVKGSRIPLASFMTMGIGFTFPVQTLYFYALIKAIGELMGVRGIYSAYGDDLIYPIAIHRQVEAFLGETGFVVNTDKTYVYEPFRESCGTDCYRGYHVRPFQPEGCAVSLSRNEYLLLLHKTYNGLLERWCQEEIPQTLLFLQKEILGLNGELLQVPLDYPDFSGIKVRYWQKDDGIIPWSQPWFDKDLFAWRFRCLGIKSKRRYVIHESAYLWDSIRSSTKIGDRIEQRALHLFGLDTDVLREYLSDLLYGSVNDFTTLQLAVDQHRKPYRSKLTGRWVKRKRAYVSKKCSSSEVVVKTGIE